MWSFGYNADLARRSETRSGLPGSSAMYWYDGQGRTSGVSKAGGAGTFGGANDCRYDPDGQLARPCKGGPTLVFDGANVVGTVTATARGWRFVGPGLDDPLIGLFRDGVSATEFYWVTDGGGRQFAVATPNGTLTEPQHNMVEFDGGAHAGGISDSHGFGAERFGTPDVPGVSFFRNRVYDQATGRFTQEDPIGVAGGLNLYQYAGNNPVMFTDPFGLCKKKDYDCQELCGSSVA